MADPTTTPHSPTPRPGRRPTLGEAVVAALPRDRIAPLAAQAQRALANLTAASYTRPPLVVQAALDAQAAAMMHAAAPAVAELARTQQLFAGVEWVQQAVERAAGAVDLSRYGGWTSPVTSELLAVGPGAQAMLRSFPPAAEHVLAAERAAASLIASTGLTAAADAALRALRVPQIAMPELISFTTPALSAVQEQLSALLRTWRQDLGFCTAYTQSRARRALVAAQAACRALEQGDVDPLRRFLWAWLRLTPTPTVVDAAVEVLLAPDWDTPWDCDESLTGDRPLAQLRAQVRGQLRATAGHDRPLWERQAAGRKVALLGQPVRGARTGGLTLGDLVADREQPDLLLGGFEDDRLRIVWSLMNERDRVVTNALTDGAPTWADAAAAAGYPPEVGEAVRKRCRRLVAEARRRVAARR